MHKVKEYKFKKVKAGKAKDIPTFFNDTIKFQFENIETIKKMHKALVSYLNSPDATLFLRLYGSYPKDKYELLRRGFLTEYANGLKMVFCDNTFSMLFAGLKISNIPYNETDLKELFNQKHLITSFGQTSKEKELSFYTPQNAIKVNLNSKGWYQAHIKPVGYGFDKLNLRTLFPNPDRNEWDSNTRVRSIKENLEGDKLKVLKAHFIRLIHPLNSFLVPKRNLVNYSGKNIGEENELIIYVQEYLKSNFPKEYEGFNEISLSYNFPKVNNVLKDIEWFDEPKAVKKKKLKTVINKPKDIEHKIVDEIEDDKLTINLDNWLRSIGKETFVDILYPELIKNQNISFEDITKNNIKYSSYSINSQKSRLSSAKSIFREGLENEALQIIIDSNNLSNSLRNKAKELLNKIN